MNAPKERRPVLSGVDNDTPSKKQRGFTAFTSICFTVNYLIGTGFLTLPWAFQQGGILLSTITMIAVIVICNTTKNYILTAMARAEFLHSMDDTDEEVWEEQGIAMLRDDHYGSTVQSHLEVFTPPSSPQLNTRQRPTLEKLVVKDRKFEYTELCRIFLGDMGEKAYVCSVAIGISLQLWGYAVVFALGMANAFPITGGGFDVNYNIYTLLFGAVVVPLSCLELREQVGFQVLLSFCRFVVIYLMIQTVLVAAHDKSGAVYFATVEDESRQTGIKLVDFTGFYEMFSVLVFTAMFHNGIPVLAEPVGNRKRLSQNFRDAIIIVCTACWVLGASVASYFGDEIEQSANLNWNDYVGGTGHPSDKGSGLWIDVGLWARIVSRFIVLFPPLNVTSAYPLNAIVLGNNLLVGAYGASAETSRVAKMFFRCLASTPPIIFALFVKELGVITSYAGVLAIVATLSFPSLLFLNSKRAMEEKGKFYATYYDGFGASINGAYSVLGISIAAIFYILAMLILR